ncbi:RTA1 like protein [Phlyctema vagabunda]|uniref:RTA1 like protein n=1 Tax=Phlyctema vagabunda TaxID=108571 RepID=A0ABR4PR48_9HELO
MTTNTNLTHSFGLGQGTGNATLLENPELCTLQTCDLTLAAFLYLPNLPGNAIFAGIFGACTIGQLAMGFRFKTWGYTTAMILGLLLEVMGYIGRILLNDSPFNNDYFLLYLITLTIAPAFMTAAIYLCLSRIVIVYGEHLSRFKPRTYTLVFCTCDLISLVLQAVGGAIASSADTQDDSDLGKNIMLAGLGFQVFSLALFALACGEFAWRVRSSKGSRNERYTELTRSKLFKGFLISLFVASATIFARCVYRCVELSGGFHSELFVSHEAVFMILEGGMISIATISLTLFNPAMCFRGAWHEANFTWRTSSTKRASQKSIDIESLNSGIPLSKISSR